MINFYKKNNLYIFLNVIFLFFVTLLPTMLFADEASDDTVTKVICNIINFVQTLGLPIMTGVILGSSIMAIFGKLGWPAIVMLVVFTAIFFGAGKVIGKFASGINAGGVSGGDFDCSQYTGTT